MRLTAYPTTATFLTLLLGWAIYLHPAAAQQAPSWQAITVSSATQTVTIHLPRQSRTVVFQNEAEVFSNGTANGGMSLLDADGGRGADNSPFTAVFANGQVKMSTTGKVLRVLLRGRTPEGAEALVSVVPADVEDCPIYTTVGPQLNATWMAQGHITVLR